MNNQQKHSKLDNYLITKFCNLSNISKDILFNEDTWYFRYLCFKYNYFIKHLILPKFKKNNLYESVFIEFRKLPHIEFLIRNTILKLGKEWSHTIVCGNKNYEYIENMCKNISDEITIINVNVENMTQNDYNDYLLTSKFWNALNGDKIFIYQEDSIIFKDNINDFLEYDYIGAPFSKSCNDTPNSVGNGGLSIRTKSKMLEIINKYNIKNVKFNTSTLAYINMVKLRQPPEDVYFSKCMQDNNIGIVADWDTAYIFSSESEYNPNSSAGHKFWIASTEWKNKMNTDFNFNKYIPRSNIKDFLKYNKKLLSLDKTKDIPNAFDIDLYFFCKVNNFEYINKPNSISYINKIGMDGFIYHSKQLFNIYPDIEIYTFLNNIYIFLNNKIYTVQDFTSKYIYDTNFKMLSDVLIKKMYGCLNNNYDILLLVFIGNEIKGIDLIERIVKYKKIQSNFNVAFCFNSKNIMNSKKIKQLIRNHFDFYSIYLCKDHGTDITPTMLMYHDIITKHKFNHIFKFHTKSIHDHYLDVTNYILSMPLKKLLSKQIDDCNCIGHPKYYVKLKNDTFNHKLVHKHSKKINLDYKFVGGTIFYAPSTVFDSVLNFIINNNYKSYLLNNLYENNTINYDYSPIHFLERLYGVISCD